MNRIKIFLVAATLVAAIFGLVTAVVPMCGKANAEGMSVAGGVTPLAKYESFIEHPETLPITYTYGEKAFRGFPAESYESYGKESYEKEGYRQDYLYFGMKDTFLEVTVEMAYYYDHNAYEWTVYFKNMGLTNTLRIANLNAADEYFYGTQVNLSGLSGDYHDNFTPYSEAVTDSKEIVNQSGRPTHYQFPYFNLNFGGDRGVFLSIGWPGTWRAKFDVCKESDKDAIRYTSGQYNVDTALLPGETLRTPLTTFLYYEGDDDHATNAWRKWMIECNIPREEDGDLKKPVLSAAVLWLYNCSTFTTEELQLEALKLYLENEIPMKYWWMDAGWYKNRSGGSGFNTWEETGIWKVDEKRFPTKFKAISDYVKEHGMDGTILWFEPDMFRIELNEVQRQFPEYEKDWVLGILPRGGKLNDYGNPDMVNWITNVVTGILQEGGIKVYRQDFNDDPGKVWFDNDKEGRTGIAENKYVQGYLTYWDNLLKNVPGLWIDTCASGGGRMDLETLRRSVPLHRTDALIEADSYITTQTISQSLFNWIPFNGDQANDSAASVVTKYGIRSAFAPSINMNFNPYAATTDFKLMKGLCEEWEIIKDFYYADYYELTGWTRDKDSWAAWEFFDPAKDAGFMQVFRRRTDDNSITLQVKGLNPKTTYYITDFDGKNDIRATGAELAAGYTVKLNKRLSAATLYIGKEKIAVPDYGDSAGDDGVDLSVPEGAIYLSDLEWESWKLYQSSSDNPNSPFHPGKDGDNFGGVMEIGSYDFTKCLWSHVDGGLGYCEFIYDISGLDVDYFQAVVGKESTGGTAGNIQFFVDVDGVRVATSRILSPGQACMIKAKVTGGKTLRFGALDGGDGDPYDAAGFGNPVLFKEPETPPEPPVTPTPSAEPSTEPSVAPSLEPTPSVAPSAEPSVEPSPSAEPSVEPSAEPSVEPSTKPSETPSAAPTEAPTDKPSETPSAAPSGQPSETPGENPSTAPTGNPADGDSGSSCGNSCGTIAPAANGNSGGAAGSVVFLCVFLTIAMLIFRKRRASSGR